MSLKSKLIIPVLALASLVSTAGCMDVKGGIGKGLEIYITGHASQHSEEKPSNTKEDPQVKTLHFLAPYERQELERAKTQPNYVPDTSVKYF